MTDDVCEICGSTGMVFELVIFDHAGGEHHVTVHLACENSRAAKHAQRLAKAGLN